MLVRGLCLALSDVLIVGVLVKQVRVRFQHVGGSSQLRNLVSHSVGLRAWMGTERFRSRRFSLGCRLSRLRGRVAAVNLRSGALVKDAPSFLRTCGSVLWKKEGV